MEERSGFSQQYISGLEQGRRNPTVVTLELDEALGVTPIYCKANPPPDLDR
jgi:transcriptional regulator with XRE-family HTH domain